MSYEFARVYRVRGAFLAPLYFASIIFILCVEFKHETDGKRTYTGNERDGKRTEADGSGRDFASYLIRWVKADERSGREADGKRTEADEPFQTVDFGVLVSHSASSGCADRGENLYCAVNADVEALSQEREGWGPSPSLLGEAAHGSKGRKLMARKSPTQRTLSALRDMGISARIVEQWLNHVHRGEGKFGIRRDLFGWIDIIAVCPIRGVGAVQSCGQSFSAHLAKLRGVRRSRVHEWLSSGAWAELWGWKRLKGVWTPRVLTLEAHDFEPE